MRETDFLDWLEHTYVTPDGSRMQLDARRTRLSNCRRVEEFLGDLDQHWARRPARERHRPAELDEIRKDQFAERVLLPESAARMLSFKLEV